MVQCISTFRILLHTQALQAECSRREGLLHSRGSVFCSENRNPLVILLLPVAANSDTFLLWGLRLVVMVRQVFTHSWFCPLREPLVLGQCIHKELRKGFCCWLADSLLVGNCSTRTWHNIPWFASVGEAMKREKVDAVFTWLGCKQLKGNIQDKHVFSDSHIPFQHSLLSGQHSSREVLKRNLRWK